MTPPFLISALGWSGKRCICEKIAQILIGSDAGWALTVDLIEGGVFPYRETTPDSSIAQAIA
jgi:hypothetical protein